MKAGWRRSAKHSQHHLVDLLMIGAQVFTVLTFYCPERRPLGNPAKNSQKSSRKKTRSCRPWIWCARPLSFLRPQKCCWPQIRAIRHSAAAPCWPRSLAPRLAPFLPASHQLVCQLSALPARANLVFWKMRSRATTTFWSSSPRHGPRGLKIGSLRPQYPKTYPQNFQPLEIVPTTTRSRTPHHPGYTLPGQLTVLSRTMIMRPAVPTRTLRVAWPLARPLLRAMPGSSDRRRVVR